MLKTLTAVPLYRNAAILNETQGDPGPGPKDSVPSTPTPGPFVKLVNYVPYYLLQPQTNFELERLRASVNRGAPYGIEPWVERMASLLYLEFILRPRASTVIETRRGYEGLGISTCSAKINIEPAL